jgi:hypothetical protein
MKNAQLALAGIEDRGRGQEPRKAEGAFRNWKTGQPFHLEPEEHPAQPTPRC